MIHFDNNKIGSYVYTQTDTKGEKHAFKIEIRSGSCDSVHVWQHKGTDGLTYTEIFNFVENGLHLRKMEVSGYDMFRNCTNIRLNLYYAQNARLTMYATKFGHNVSCYYKKPEFKEED